MAVLNSEANNVSLVYSSGTADVIALLSLRNVTADDTIDVSSWFQVVNRAVVIGVTEFVEIAANYTGTVVTMPSGLTNDCGYLLLWGSGS